MAMNRKEIQHGSWILMKGTIRFLFMVINNLVAIPSYILYLIVLQPLKLLNSKLFWHVEGIMFKWLLAMVSSWGWTAGYTVVEWGDDVKAITEDETMVLVNHQATGDVCTLMMCLQDKGTGKAHRDQQLILLRQHLEKYYRNRDRKWIVLFPEGGFLRKRRETSQSFAKKNNLPFLKHVTLPRQGATEVILQTLCTQHENGAVGDANGAVEKQKGLQWVIDITIAYHKAKPIDIQTWIIGYREPTVTHVHYRIYPIKDVPMESEALTRWLYQRFVEKDELLAHFYETGAFPPPKGQTTATSRAMTLDPLWLFLIQLMGFLSGYMWYNVLQYMYNGLGL
ncbi:acyl-CoA:lysophosphatidylglycerol acyltransferase 1 isoform X2 [Scyliorhinus canicula]|uniref:acyl-CoA:lysophosphatidylglycerol acyltransferase 1 isoform X2 n=1 Tax=Scyliorhinus canicula TaxID=7830 RepID=UPI0018F6767F|nr:acyl-CoA:lysophosphatidylglycerol acyltransferase 1 isoform X2 [Scyliorhinus canicula]